MNYQFSRIVQQTIRALLNSWSIKQFKDEAKKATAEISKCLEKRDLINATLRKEPAHVVLNKQVVVLNAWIKIVHSGDIAKKKTPRSLI